MPLKEHEGTTYNLRVKINEKEFDEVLKKFYEAVETVINLAYQMQTWPSFEITAVEGTDHDDGQKVNNLG